MSKRQYRGEERLKALKRLVEALDSARAGSLRLSLRKMEEEFKSLKLKDSPHKWKVLARDVKEILEIPLGHPEFDKVKTADRVASALAYASMFGLIAGLYFALTGDRAAFSYALFTVLALTNASLMFRVYESGKLSMIYRDREDVLEQKSRRIKEVIEYLIEKLRSEARKEKVEVTMNLKFADYRGIKVLKPPSLFRSTYKVALER